MTATDRPATETAAPPRDHDIVIYGASGFVGRQTVAYLVRHAPPGLRWAIAGRDRAKLEAVKARAGRAEVDVLVADGRDPPAIEAVVAGARVVLNTAGPFAIYGDAVVAACVRHRTDYVDITGEVLWARSLIDRHHARAAADGTRIVPFCGFDSIPSDLGVLLAVRQLQRRTGAPCDRVSSYFEMRGGLNGGTIATMFHGIDAGAGIDDPFLLDPGGVHTPEQRAASRDVTGARFDETIGAWVGPFVMGPINTRVVRRSAGLFAQWGEPYGPRVIYQEHAKYGGRRGRVLAPLMSVGAAGFEAALARGPTRALLKALLPKPGEGPSEKTMDAGFFRCEVVAVGAGGRTARVFMQHAGDPGNRATTRLVCESALCLALDRDRLPGGPRRGGVLTPATALGEVLAERLRDAGVAIEVRD